MATFPNLNLGATNLSDFQFGLGNSLGTLGYGDGSAGLLTAGIGANTGASIASNTASTMASTGLMGGSNGFLSGLFSDNGLFSRNSMFGGTDTATGMTTGGWVSPIAAVGSAIFSGIQGNKQLSLAQDQFEESRRQFNANYNAQVKTTNTQLEDRQRARVAANPGAYESVSDYMSRNRLS